MCLDMENSSLNNVESTQGVDINAENTTSTTNISSNGNANPFGTMRASLQKLHGSKPKKVKDHFDWYQPSEDDEDVNIKFSGTPVISGKRRVIFSVNSLKEYIALPTDVKFLVSGKQRANSSFGNLKRVLTKLSQIASFYDASLGLNPEEGAQAMLIEAKNESTRNLPLFQANNPEHVEVVQDKSGKKTRKVKGLIIERITKDALGNERDINGKFNTTKYIWTESQMKNLQAVIDNFIEVISQIKKKKQPEIPVKLSTRSYSNVSAIIESVHGFDD
jgi:hypothetical protein